MPLRRSMWGGGKEGQSVRPPRAGLCTLPLDLAPSGGSRCSAHAGRLLCPLLSGPVRPRPLLSQQLGLLSHPPLPRLLPAPPLLPAPQSLLCTSWQFHHQAFDLIWRHSFPCMAVGRHQNPQLTGWLGLLLSQAGDAWSTRVAKVDRFQLPLPCCELLWGQGGSAALMLCPQGALWPVGTLPEWCHHLRPCLGLLLP